MYKRRGRRGLVARKRARCRLRRLPLGRLPMKKRNGLPPVHPGEIIREDILPEAGLSVTAVAKSLGVSRHMLHDILAERKPQSAAMFLKFSRLLGSTRGFCVR